MALFWNRRQRRIRRSGGNSRSVWRQILYGVLSILFVVTTGYGTWYVTRLPAFTISNVEVADGDTVSHEEIKHRVESGLEGNYIFLVPKRFTYFYPHDDIQKDVAAMSRIAKVKLEKVDHTTLNVSFEEHVPRALWCLSAEVGTSTQLSGLSTDCVFLSDDGYAFADAPELRGGVYLRHISDDRQPEATTQFLPATDMGRIATFTEALEIELGFRTYMVEHTAVGDEVYYLTGGGKFLVSPSELAQTTFDNLRSILESEEFSHIAPGNFNYIDLRFGNRVFVNEEFPEENETSAATEKSDAADMMDEAE